MDNNVIEIVIKATDFASGKLEDVGKTAEKQGAKFAQLGKQFVTAGTMLTGMGVAGAVAMNGWLNAASEAQAQMTVANTYLENASKSMGVSFDSLSKTVGDTSKAMIQLGFDDEDTAVAFSKLIVSTKDTALAQKALESAMDIASAKGISLEAATKAVNMAMQGSPKFLKEYQIAVKEGASATEILNSIQGAVGGTAQKMSGTYAVALKAMSIQTTNLKEALGERLIPTITDLVSKFTGFITKLNDTNPQMLDLIVKVVAIGTVFALVGGPILMLIGTFMMFGTILAGISTAVILPAIAIIAGLAAVATAVYLVFANWTKIKDFFVKLGADIAEFAEKAGVMIMNFIEVVGTFFHNLFSINIPYEVGYFIGWITAKWPEFNLWFWEQVTQLITTVSNLFKQMGIWVIARLTEMWTWIKTEVPTWPGKFVAWLSSLPKLISDIFEDAKNKAIGMAKGLYDGVKGWLDSVIGWLKDVWSWGEKAGQSIANAFDKGKQAGAVQGSRADGGWINSTGLYLMHQGEYVMSNAMLQGNQRSEITNNHSNPVVNVYATVSNNTDVQKLAYALAYELRNK